MNVNVNEMTIKEIADIKGVTFQTINRYIKENNLKETKTIKRAKYYNVNEFDNIKTKKVNNKNDNVSIELILKEQIEYLKNQIKEKDEQINKLQIIIDQQQKLELVNRTKDKKNSKLLFWKRRD